MGFFTPFYTAIVVLFQAFPGSWVLATPSSTVHKTKYLDPYHWSHISFSCLFLRQWCRDVTSGADRHLVITFGMQVFHSLACVLFRKALNHPYISFFHLLVNGFSVTCFPTFFADSLPSFNWWAVSVGGEELKWASASTLSLNEPAKGLTLVHTE